MKLFVAVSGEPDTNIEAQSEDDIAEQGKTLAVTEGAVRNTDQGIPHTAPSGAKTTSTFRSVVNSVFVVPVSNTRHKILRYSHMSLYVNTRIYLFVCTHANDVVIRLRRSFVKNMHCLF